MSEDNNRIAISASDVESNTRNASLGEKKIKRLATRCNIRVYSYRATKHDPDGISVKAVLDGLTRSGVLQDDSTEQVKSITFESRKCKKGEEKTIIEIEDDNYTNVPF